MGDAINLAARMEQNAPVGGILISHDTYRHVRGVFDVEPQEPLLVKGKAEPVETYVVQRAKERAFRVDMRGFEGLETRMVGRDVEMLALQNVYEDTIEDRETHVVTIVGEAGVGKTRLLQEFGNWCELRPELYWFFRGSALSTTRGVPYSLWRDVLAYRFQILESDRAAEALRKFRQGMEGILEPDRADLVGQLVGFNFSASPAVAPLLGSDSFGHMATAYLVRYFRGLLAQQPLVMLLEDLQWADDSSLDLVAHLVGEIPDAPLLVVGAARPELYERRPSWGEGLEAYSRLELKPLSKRASRDLVSEILQRVQRVPESLRQLVVEGGEGNPYYVEELIKMLIEDGVIVPGEEEWTVDESRLAAVRVPSSLTGILQARLDALPREEKEVLQRAAVVGRLFWDSVVRELAGDEVKGEVDTVLGSLRQREMVYRRERSTFEETREYTFKHSILRDVTYETVLLRLRRRYHAQVAAWLEASAGERLGEYLGLIGTHYELAGEGAQAAEYLQRSGEEAFQVSAFRDARLAFQRALELLPQDGSVERAALHAKLGQADIALGDYAAAWGALSEGLRLARATGDQIAEAAALTGLGEIAWRQGDQTEAGDHLREGLRLARECGDVGGQALAAQHLARVNWLRGAYDEARSWAEESQRLYEGLGDRRGLISALNELGIVASNRDQFQMAREYFKANLVLSREIGDRLRASTASNNLGETLRLEARYAEATVHYEEALAVSREIGDRLGAALALTNLACTYISQSRDSLAWDYLRRSLREWGAMRDIPHAVADLVTTAHLYARSGARHRSAELLGLALAHPASYSEVERDAEPVLALLRAELDTGELEAALARGAEMDLEEVVAELLAEGDWGG
jgi:tetratricopeptide (TPR) repeat protein